MALLTLALTVACSGSRPRPVDPWLSANRTCLVLSVGGPAGVAHLGALEALRRERVRIDCVSGNSMGALIGSMYAFAPQDDTTALFRIFVEAYDRVTRSAARRNAIAGGILGAVLLGAITGGAGAAVVLGGGMGALVGAEGTTKIGFDRMVRVLDELYGGASIENLGIPYATFHQRREKNGVVLVDVRTGNLARAALMSAANPFVFEDFDARDRDFLDPGSDRSAMTPIEDTCRLFPDARLIAINVTGQPAKYESKLPCPVLEVAIEAPQVTFQELRRLSNAFDAARRAGFDATMQALRSRLPR